MAMKIARVEPGSEAEALGLGPGDELLSVDESTKIESEFISGSVSDEMKVDAAVATLIATLCMLLYIWIRFRKLSTGISAVLALVHDVIAVLTVYVVASAFIPVGRTFIACMLTIVGNRPNVYRCYPNSYRILHQRYHRSI